MEKLEVIMICSWYWYCTAKSQPLLLKPIQSSPLAPSQPSRDALENPKEHRRNTRHLLNPPRYHDQHSTAVEECVYLVDEEYLVTALVPSETACLASSPGRMRRTLKSVRKEQLMGIEETYEVWISREEIVDFLLYAASFDASVATRSNISENAN